MTDLTALTLSEARDLLKAKEITAAELTGAHVAAIDAANVALNAYIVTTADKAMDMAKASDARLSKGKGLPLDGLPIGIKDLYCTKGVRSTACSAILGDFEPVYESAVTQNLCQAVRRAARRSRLRRDWLWPLRGRIRAVRSASLLPLPAL
jgi:aspartyl-tRNA(Asn)/glutamyl-tRNA(Gln) amidotransferase subunit A